MEFEGSTEQEAIENAAKATGHDASSLEYTVVDEGSAGVFGIGSRPVRIRVATEAGGEALAAPSEDSTEVRASYGPAPEKAEKALEVAKGLLQRMGLDQAQVSVWDEDQDIVIVLEEGEGRTDLADVLGRSRPPAIPALQFLLNKIVNRFPEDRKHISVQAPALPKRPPREPPEEKAPRAPLEVFPDVSTLKNQVDPELDVSLVELAHEVAQKALALQKVVTIHPMQAADRRAVHQTVTVLPGVHTVSEGEGLYRRMHIVPDALGGDTGAKRKRKRRRRRPPKAGGASSAPTA